MTSSVGPKIHRNTRGAPKRRLLVGAIASIAIVASLPVLAACASSDSQSAQQGPKTSAAPADRSDGTSTPPTTRPDYEAFLESAAAVASPIESFPVPEIAEQENLVYDAVAPANGTVMDNADYGFAPGITVSSIRRWYTEVQPEGSQFGQWSWCETIPLGAESTSLWWSKPGTDQMLGLIITEGEPENGLPTAAVRIATEDSGPC